MDIQEKATPENNEVRISINALQNIEEITGYIAFVRQQPLNAAKVGDALFATIDHISVNPFAFVGAKAVKAALANPVKSLRSE